MHALFCLPARLAPCLFVTGVEALFPSLEDVEHALPGSRYWERLYTLSLLVEVEHALWVSFSGVEHHRV